MRSVLKRFSVDGFEPVGRINDNGRLYVISPNAFGNPLAKSAKAKEQLSEPTFSHRAAPSVIDKTTKPQAERVC